MESVARTLSRILRRFSTLLTDEAHRSPDGRPLDVALVPLWASSPHLAVPLVGLDGVLGVLFVRGTDLYTDHHLRLLSGPDQKPAIDHLVAPA